MEKFGKKELGDLVEESEDLESDALANSDYIEVEKAIQNPESLSDKPLSYLADLLNKASCNDFSEHPLKKIVSEIIDHRYPHSDGWESFTGNSGYIDHWIRSKNGRQAGIDCTVSGVEPNVEYDWSGHE